MVFAFEIQYWEPERQPVLNWDEILLLHSWKKLVSAQAGELTNFPKQWLSCRSSAAISHQAPAQIREGILLLLQAYLRPDSPLCWSGSVPSSSQNRGRGWRTSSHLPSNMEKATSSLTQTPPLAGKNVANSSFYLPLPGTCHTLLLAHSSLRLSPLFHPEKYFPLMLAFIHCSQIICIP